MTRWIHFSVQYCTELLESESGVKIFRNESSAGMGFVQEVPGWKKLVSFAEHGHSSVVRVI